MADEHQYVKLRAPTGRLRTQPLRNRGACCQRRLRAAERAGVAPPDEKAAMTSRRALLIAGSGALACTAAQAQQAGKTYRIGWLSTTTRDQPYFVAMMKRLAELGFVEGRNLVIEFRLAPVHDAYERFAGELGQARCDLLFAPGNALALQALVQATRDTPIVIAAIDDDPVAAGFVASMARPGGRVTGISQLQLELPAKRLEVMRSMLPKLRRVGVLTDASSEGQLPVLRRAAGVLGLELVVHNSNPRRTIWRLPTTNSPAQRWKRSCRAPRATSPRSARSTSNWRGSTGLPRSTPTASGSSSVG